MICFAKPGLTEDLLIVRKEDFSVTCYLCDTNTWQRRSLHIRDKPILSSARTLRKDYDRKISVAKKLSSRDPQGALRQDDWLAMNR
jgi:hypothetical protein